MSLLFQENSVRTPFRAEFLGGKNLWVVKLCRIRHRNSSCFCLLRDGGRSFSLFQAQPGLVQMVGFDGNLASHRYFTGSKGRVSMSSESSLRIIDPEDNAASVLSQHESAIVEENKRLRLRMLEMWDIWSNCRDHQVQSLDFPS
ncbi:uncharacterized protein LOC107805237 [Nicotiana tabacum]|uniref:Uncharacterized protein LOC107805237 n=1 Tax=Nicotiana tabacum TaxID=4097 RepID=A0AC58UNT9_TOBAC